MLTYYASSTITVQHKQSVRLHHYACKCFPQTKLHACNQTMRPGELEHLHDDNAPEEAV